MIAAVTGWSIRQPVIVTLLWLAIVVGCFTAGVGVFDRLVSEVGAVPGSESDRARSLLAQAEPDLPNAHRRHLRPTRSRPGAPGRDRCGGRRPTTPARCRAGHRTTAVHHNRQRTAPAGSAAPWRRIDTATVAVAGGPLSDDEFNVQAQSDVQRAELLSTPVLLLLLLIVFGGLIAAGLPLLIAAVGVAGTFGVLFAVSLVTEVSVYAIQVTTMLSVGLAVDYGLLMLSRFREERVSEPDIGAALARAAATAGHTIAFSGLTVAAALAGLLVFPDPFLRSMGVSGVAVVAVGVAAALTLLPALLALVGRRISPAKPPAGAFARITRAVQRRPLATAIAAAGVMVVLAIPVLDLRLGQVDARLLPASTQTRQLHDAIAAHYPELNGPDPIVVVAVTPTNSRPLARYHDLITTVPDVASVDVGRPGPTTVIRVHIAQAADAGRAVAAIRAIPAPFEVAVTGAAAILADYRSMLTDRLPWAVTLVALGTLVLLFLFTGSVLLPVKAVLTNLLSIGAALGAVVWVFQQGHLAGWFGTERLDTTHLSVPVLVAAIAFGLSVDYEVFLLSRIRERWLAGADNDQAVVEGLQHTGRIITCAALLLGVVFAGFLTAGFVPVKAIGLGLVLAVALDATIVRLLLVPATMTLFGRYNWWAPGLLRRIHARASRAEPPAAGTPLPVEDRHRLSTPL